MTKGLKRSIAVLLTLLMLLISFSFAVPVNAESTPDLKKANVKWDLKNKKTIKYKTKWYAVGVKKHTVKMTNFKVRKSDKEGYKVCTFTLTFNRKINPTKKQVNKMGYRIDEYGSYGGDFYYTVVDYRTGMSLEGENDKDVTVTDSGWKHSKYHKIKGTNGAWIRYAKKSTVKVKIVYPETYKDLAIGVGGHPNLKDSDNYWEGNQSFSKTTSLYSKKDKSYAHFMRVKK